MPVIDGMRGGRLHVPPSVFAVLKAELDGVTIVVAVGPLTGVVPESAPV